MITHVKLTLKFLSLKSSFSNIARKVFLVREDDVHIQDHGDVVVASNGDCGVCYGLLCLWVNDNVQSYQ